MLRVFVFCVKVSRDGKLWEQKSQPRPHSLRITRSLDGVRPASNAVFRLAHRMATHRNYKLRPAECRAESGPGKALNTVMNIRLRLQEFRVRVTTGCQADLLLVTPCWHWPLIGWRHMWCFHERETRHWQSSETSEPLCWRSKLRMSEYNSQVDQKLSKFTSMLSLEMHDMIAVFMVFEQSVIIMNSILSYSYTEQTQLNTTRQPAFIIITIKCCKNSLNVNEM